MLKMMKMLIVPQMSSIFRLFFLPKKSIWGIIALHMLEFKEKQKARKMRYSKPVLFVLAVILLVSLEGLLGIYRKHSEALEKAETARIDLLKLREREAELEKKVAFLKTERGKDEEIRKKFMVGKEGEGVILVVDATPSTTPPAPAPKPSAWTRFLDFFR
jgi:cell division protein FtsB